MDSPSLKVLADHIRACSFLIADGVIPATKAAATCCAASSAAPSATATSWARAAFFHKMVPDLVAEMGEAYPELKAEEAARHRALKQEEDRFFATIENGMAILEGRTGRRPPPAAPVQRRNRLQAARHLRLPARPHRRHLPRTRHRRRRRLRRRDGPPEGTGAPPASSRWPPTWNTTARPPPSTATTARAKGKRAGAVQGRRSAGQ